MTLNAYPGSLQATRWAGSQPPAFDASRITTGTVAVARTPNFALTGTLRPIGGNMGVFIAPPPRPRYVAVSGVLAPTAMKPSNMILKQQRLGTISAALIDNSGFSARAEVAGWVLPTYGSYVVGTYQSGVGMTGTKWNEFNP